MSDTADVIVIGSGALGGSMAYLLGRTGRRVLLLDRHEIASQTSPRAAGLSAVSRPDALMTRLARRGTTLLEAFERETGIAIGLHRSGSLKVARHPALAEQLRAEVARATGFGVKAAEIDAAAARALMPLLRTDRAAAISHYPEDIYLDPALFTRGVSQAAGKAGCVLRPHTTVEEIVVTAGRVTGVRTDAGDIAAPVVVDAAGAWARGLARTMRLPMIAVRHQLLVTRPLPEVRPEFPITRMLDANVYVRPCDGGLMLGGYETTPLLVEDVPQRVEDVALDTTVLRGFAEAVAAEFPVLADLDGARSRAGLPTMTLDDEHLVGPVPGAEGLFVLGGCNVGGLSTALAFAEALLAVIEDPAAAKDIAPLLPERFAGRSVTEEALREACRLHYGQHYWGAAARAAL